VIPEGDWLKKKGLGEETSFQPRMEDIVIVQKRTLDDMGT